MFYSATTAFLLERETERLRHEYHIRRSILYLDTLFGLEDTRIYRYSFLSAFVEFCVLSVTHLVTLFDFSSRARQTKSVELSFTEGAVFFNAMNSHWGTWGTFFARVFLFSHGDTSTDGQQGR